MHVVVIGCGRVGSELAGALELAGHSVAVVDKNPPGLRPPPRRLQRPHRAGLRIRSRSSRRGGHRRGGSAGFGDQRRQLQHPVRAHRTRDVRHRAGRRPHLRPAARAHLSTARDPDGRDRLVDDRSGAAPAPPRRRPGTTGSTRPRAWGWSNARSRPPRSATRSGGSNRPGRFWLTAVSRFGKAQIVTSDMVGQEGDVLTFVTAMDAIDELQAHIDAGGDH